MIKISRPTVIFLASICVGLILWAASPFLFGELLPRRFWLVPLGLFLGQFLDGLGNWILSVVAYSGGGVNFFIPLGAMFLLWMTLPTLIGAFLGRLAGLRYAKPRT